MKLQKNILSKIILAFIVLASICVTFYQFPAIPQNLSFDEVEFARLALSLKDSPYIPYSPLATGHATMYFYVLLTSLQSFGVNSFALRFPAALFGVINVLVFYVLMKKVFESKDNHWLPLILTFIFATLRWYFNFARFSFEATFLLFFELTSLIFILKFSEKKEWKYLALSGAFAGLAYNSYTPGRLFFIIPLLFLFLTISRKTFNLKLFTVNLGTFLLPFIILILPLTWYLSNNPDIRLNQLSYINNEKVSPVQKADYFFKNVGATAGMFHLKGDLNGRQNYPGKATLNPILGILFVIGLGIAIWKWKNKYNQLFLMYFVISIIPALMTYPWENPHMLRTFTAIPAVVYFVGVALQKIFEIKLNKSLLLGGVLLLIVMSTFYEVRTYFMYQTQVFPEAFEMKGSLEKLIKMKPGAENGAK